MNELTKEQLAMVEAAMNKALPDYGGICTHTETKAKILAELTPKPKFTVGQVLCFVARDGDYEFLQYHAETNMNWAGWQSLNQAEVGPDWIPSSEVPGYKIAVEALKKVIAEFDGDTEGYIDISKVREALSRIKEMGGDVE